MPIKLNVPSSRSRKVKNSYAKDGNKDKYFNLSYGTRIKTLFVALSIITVFCAVLFFLGFGIIKIYRFAVTAPYFNTVHIDVSGNIRLAKDELIAIAGLKLGENSLAVNIGQVERELLLIPWVDHVSVKRLLPDGFAIKIKEHIPFFWVRKQGQLNYADIYGNIIAPVDSLNFTSLPTLSVQSGSEYILSSLGALVKDIETGVLPIEFTSVSSINVSRTKGVEFYIEDRQMYLSIAVKDWGGNLKRLAITMNDVIRRNELDKIKEIHAANGNVWVTKKDK